MKKNTTLFFLIFLLFCAAPGAWAQVTAPAPNVPTPNAASLGLYNQVPVDLFSGLPSISIPIYDLQDGAAKIPLSLSYHPASVKPENHPGWMGLGWNLSVGGSITRVVNGAPDEVATGGNNLSYYYHPQQLNRIDWASSDYLEAFSRSNATVPVPFPDEFIFNFNGYQGSFYYNHLGKWVVKTSGSSSLKIQESVATNFKLRCDDNAEDDTADGDEKTLQQIFQQFTLTTEDGTKYIFGGISNSIEFCRRALELDAFNVGIIPTTWHLTKIVYATGEEVNLKYIRKGCAFTQNIQSSIYEYKLMGINGSQRSTNPAEKSIVNLYPVYLTEITSPTKKITFTSQRTTELNYTFDTNKIKYYSFNQKNIPNKTWYKLTSIVIDEKNAPSPNAQTISFSYTDQSNKRLTLNEVSYGEVNGNKKRYRLAYSGVALPDYNSQMLDHWGFYNGVNFFKKYPLLQVGDKYTKEQCATYTLTREPDPTYVTAGLLTALYYPTGGFAKFEWQPHQYAAIATKYPFGIQNLTADQTAGGARIQKIIFKEDEDTPLLVKEYFYQTNYINTTSGLSSGILAGQSVYLEEGSNSAVEFYWYWNDYSIEPLCYTNGNHVTYSEVTEKSSDGNGYTVYTYSNHNKAEYRDKAYLNGAVTSNDQWRYDPFTSLELERGKLLSQVGYNEGKKPQESTTYRYNEDQARVNFENNIRVVELKQRSFNKSVPLESRAMAYLIYTYPTSLSQQTHSVYNVDGTSPVVTTTDYAYNVDNLLQQTSTTTSTRAARSTTYTYPFDYSTTAMGGVMGQLQSKNMLDRVIEERVNENGLTIGGKVNQYNADGQLVGQHLFEAISPVANMPFSNTNINPSTTYYKPRLTLSYDAAKNLASQQVIGDVASSYLWGYSNTLLIAKVKNASSTQIAHTSFEEETDVARFSTESRTGRKSLKVAYTVKLPSVGTYVLTYWKKEGTGNWIPVQQVISTDTPIGGGTGVLIDEVRVFPKGAEMSTYTHDVLLGVTSSTDANNVTTYYEYDGLQRLQYLKDQDGNIVKSYGYHYKQ